MATPGASGGGLTELWARLRFVVIAVIVYRIGAHIPVPGINPDRLADLFEQSQGTILSLFNMFSGGALGADVDPRTWNHALHFGGDCDATADRGRPIA